MLEFVGDMELLVDHFGGSLLKNILAENGDGLVALHSKSAKIK